MDTTLPRHRAYLVAWALLVVTHFLAINLTDLRGADFTGLAQFWHPYYFNVLYATTLVIPVLLFNVGVVRRFGGFGSYIGRSIAFLSIGAVLWGIGNLVWFYYNGCLEFPGPLACSSATADNVPYPSLADAGYLALLPFAGLSLYYLTRVLALTWADLLRMSWIAVVIFAVTGYYTLPQVTTAGFEYGKSWLFSPDYSFAATAISSLYVVTDVVLLSLGVMLLWHARRAAGGVFFMGVLAVAAAMCAQYVGDLFFFKRVAEETYFNGDFSDGLYAVSMLLMTASAYYFSRAEYRMRVGVEQPVPNAEVVA